MTRMNTKTIKVLPDATALCHAAAEEFIHCAGEAIASHSRFCVALSGGSTPRGVYSLLAERPADLPWNSIFVFFGDERHGPPEHPASNSRMPKDARLSRGPMPHATD